MKSRWITGGHYEELYIGTVPQLNAWRHTAKAHVHSRMLEASLVGELIYHR
jgi:hypothetical protein